MMMNMHFDSEWWSRQQPLEGADAKFNTVTDRVHRELPGYAYRLTKEESLKMS